MLGEENYTLDIRPTFVDELDAAVRYIECTFKNYAAADDLIAKTYAAIDERLSHQNLSNRAIESRMFANPTIAYPSGTSRFTTSFGVM